MTGSKSSSVSCLIDETPPSSPVVSEEFEWYDKVTKNHAIGERYGFGWCYLECFTDVMQASKKLDVFPNLKRAMNTKVADDDFGPWAVRLPDEPQINTYWDNPCVSFEEWKPPGLDVVMALHVKTTDRPMGYNEWALLSKHYGSDVLLGARLSELVDRAGELTGQAEQYAIGALAVTSDLNDDAADNYARLGDYMESVHERGGFKDIAEGKFVAITQGLISRWASSREATAAARLAANLVFNDKDDEPWSPSVFEEAMEVEEDEQEKQARLLRMAGLAFAKGISNRLEDRRRRQVFAHWKADALAPAKAFCRAIGVEDYAVDVAVDRGVKLAVPHLVWAAMTLRDHSMTAVKVMGAVAGGGIVAASVFAAAGLVLDWYYADKASQKLGVQRVSVKEGYSQFNSVTRAQSLFAAGMAMSDEVYDTTAHTHTIRLDPFFFSIRADIARLKDDTAAARQLTNTVLPPLLQTISSSNKTMILLPGSITEESARHIQEAMPEFYFRIVNRNHTHPELWAVRRGFEMMVARAVVASSSCKRVVMIGGNVRQVSKIPGVIANYGPIVSGRDDFRHDTKGTVAQRNLFRQLNIPERFGNRLQNFGDSTGVSFYSTQDMHKEDYIRAAIASGIRKHYIAMNIPIVMMDPRVTEWDDNVLGARFVKRGGVLSMSPMKLPVAGYDNDFEATMSWVKPHKPFLGYDITVSAVAQVGSSYLLEMDIGSGPQESHDTVWRMPDAGQYVLLDLTREHDEPHYYAVPAPKFDSVVKFVIQMNGAKNVVEATAGRILGLEAQIKIGGSVLERAWHQNHREFASTMIHALTCAGLDKSDALHMMGQLRQHFSDHKILSYTERMIKGYAKLFGREADYRMPGKAKRGASDYDPVLHWTSRQSFGSGFAESFRPALKDEGFKEKDKKLVPCEDKDEGYISAEMLNEEDAPSSDADTRPFSERFGEWFRPKFSMPVAKESANFHGFKADTRTLQLTVDPHEILIFGTDAPFNPEGLPEFGTVGGSLGDTEFKRRYGSENDVKLALRENAEFPAPDVGASSIVEWALAEERRTTAQQGPFHKWVSTVAPVGIMEELEEKFFSEVNDDPVQAIPALLLDGIAGAAKSSTIRAVLRATRVSCAIVCPTRKLARDWQKHKVGSVVTKHKLMLSTLRGRELLVVDEAYAYTKHEMHALLHKAARAQLKVVLLGDRRQQYEDGGEITSGDLKSYGYPCMRMCVSNTMPIDALKIARWAGQGDAACELFQTRNKRVHSICVRQKDDAIDKDDMLKAVAADNCILFKDRLGPSLDYENVSDEELGFTTGKEEDWLSVSRTQGLRTQHSILLSGRFSKTEKWFSEQPGLFYVAVSRHSESMLYWADQYDLNKFQGLEFTHHTTVNGRLSALQARERFEAPMFVLDAKLPKPGLVTSTLQQRGMWPQTVKFRSIGTVKEDWRPWHKFNNFAQGTAADLFAATTQNLVGEQTPYVSTDAAKMPTYQDAMGLKSMRRPNLWAGEKLNARFTGLDRLAVLQNSKDELLDQKNVIERTARPRLIDEDPYRVAIQAGLLYEKFKQLLMADEGEVHLSTFPSPDEWATSRTTDFATKFSTSDPYGLTSFSVRSQGFLKTQTKVKLKRTFALEENYGQTVLASPADFNGIFGPWSKMFLRNLRLSMRRGVILDSGFSDRELARELRAIGALQRFGVENYQADVKRQDTSHTPITLRVFKMLLSDMGVPDDLCELYETHSRQYEYNSMHAGLYRGEARYNLGSGDPFTLIRNIIEVLTVMVERFGDSLEGATMIVKGDDFISDKIFTQLPVQVPEIRATQLTEEFNKPPYHAGRFLIDDDIIPDPVRMISKILVKRSDTVDRVNQLAESFYDRYVHLTDYSYARMSHYVVEAYGDFDPEFPLAALNLYHALRDRTLFFELLSDDSVENNDKLVVVDSEENCAVAAASWFTRDAALFRQVKNEDVDTVECVLARHHVPVYRLRGKPNDFLKRGVWLSADHAWAVVGLTEYKLRETNDCAI